MYLCKIDVRLIIKMKSYMKNEYFLKATFANDQIWLVSIRVFPKIIQLKTCCTISDENVGKYIRRIFLFSFINIKASCENGSEQ